MGHHASKTASKSPLPPPHHYNRLKEAFGSSEDQNMMVVKEEPDPSTPLVNIGHEQESIMYNGMQLEFDDDENQDISNSSSSADLTGTVAGDWGELIDIALRKVSLINLLNH